MILNRTTLSIVTILCIAHIACAATWTWDGGGGDDLWSTADNWVEGTAPTEADTTDLIFGGTQQL